MNLKQSTEMIKKNATRNSNLELLRIIATLFVIILHYNNTGSGGGFLYTAELGYHYHILLGFEMMAICAVDVFIMISGYFMCEKIKVSISKPLLLYAEVITFSFFRYGMNLFLGRVSFSNAGLLNCLIPRNWYVTVYIALYLISPYLNKIIRGITEAQFRTLLIVGFIVFSIWPSALDLIQARTAMDLSSMSPLGVDGSGQGYTIVNFVFMYFVGAYLRYVHRGGTSALKIHRSITVYLLCTFILFVYARISFSGALAYCNPIVIVQSVVLFEVFYSLRINSEVINAVAGCSFGVYLLHSNFFPMFDIKKYVTGNILFIPVHVIATALLIYGVSAVIYWIYLKTLHSLISGVAQRFNFISYEVQ